MKIKLKKKKPINVKKQNKPSKFQREKKIKTDEIIPNQIISSLFGFNELKTIN